MIRQGSPFSLPRFAKNLYWTRLCEGRGSSLNLGRREDQASVRQLAEGPFTHYPGLCIPDGPRGHCVGALLRWLRARCCRREDIPVGDRIRTSADRKGGRTGDRPGSQPGARSDDTTGRGVHLAVGVLLANIAPGAPPTEADGKVASVVHLSKSRPWRAITIAGFAPSLAERQALYAIAERHQTLIQIHSDAVPPHSWELLVLQERGRDRR